MNQHDFFAIGDFFIALVSWLFSFFRKQPKVEPPAEEQE
jgi:hypothetical protein